MQAVAVPDQASGANSIEIVRSHALARRQRAERFVITAGVSAILALFEFNCIYRFFNLHEQSQLWFAIAYALAWAATLAIFDGRWSKERHAAPMLSSDGVVDGLGDFHVWSEFESATLFKRGEFKEIRLHRTLSTGYLCLLIDPAVTNGYHLLAFARQRIQESQGSE